MGHLISKDAFVSIFILDAPPASVLVSAVMFCIILAVALLTIGFYLCRKGKCHVIEEVPLTDGQLFPHLFSVEAHTFMQCLLRDSVLICFMKL